MGRETRVLFLPDQGRAAFRLKRPEENIGIMPKYRVIYCGEPSAQAGNTKEGGAVYVIFVVCDFDSDTCNF